MIRPERAAPYRKIAWLLGAAMLLTVCDRSKPEPPQETVTTVDRVAREPAKQPVNFLHKTFPVQKYAKFEFVVPPHSPRPRLLGSFKAFVIGSNGASTSDDRANVDLLLLTEDEFNAFAHDTPGLATYSIDASYTQTVDFALTATLDQPQKFYLVFRNSSGGSRSKFVDADFTLSFE